MITMHLHRPVSNGNGSRKIGRSRTAPGRTAFHVQNALDRTSAKRPLANVTESSENYTVELAVPGLKKEMIEIRTMKGILTIKADAELDVDGKIRRREFDFGKFERNFRLPEDVSTEAITAEYTDGILTVVLPKSPEAKEKQIEIK